MFRWYYSCTTYESRTARESPNNFSLFGVGASHFPWSKRPGVTEYGTTPEIQNRLRLPQEVDTDQISSFLSTNPLAVYKTSQWNEDLDASVAFPDGDVDWELIPDQPTRSQTTN
jgi:hypothetical protein